MRRTWLMVVVVMVLIASHAVAEKLGEDGFPADWKPEDFALGSNVDTGKVEGNLSPTAVKVEKKKGVVSFPIDALPRVKVASGTIPLPEVTSATVAVSLPSSTQGPVIPVVDALTAEPPKELAALDAWGALPTAKGGFDSPWKGVSRSEAIGLLQGMGTEEIASPVLRQVWVRLLLSGGVPDGQISGTTGGWLAARAEALGKTGLDEAAYVLWHAVPPMGRNSDSALARGWALSHLQAGIVTEPCALARRVVVSATVPPWREAAVICGALDRVGGGLDMSLAMAQEEINFDPLLRQLLLALRDDQAPVVLAGEEKVSPLVASVLAAYPALISDKDLGRMPAVVLRRLVQTASLPLALRTRAAETLLQQMPEMATAEALRVFYEAFDFPPDQYVNALTAAPTLAGPDARAMLWQTVRRDGGVAGRVAAWQQFKQRAEADGVGVVPVLLGPGRAGISSTVDMAEAGSREAWQMGDAKAAAAWQTLLANVNSPTVALVQARARVGMVTSAISGQLAEQDFNNWLAGLMLGAHAGADDAVRHLSVLEGLGVVLPADAWKRLAQVLALRDVSASGGDVLSMAALHEDVAAGRVAPVLARLVLWAQQSPPNQWPPLQANTAVEALRRLNMTGEARLLAVEMLTSPIKGSPAKAKSGVKPLPKVANPTVKIDVMQKSRKAQRLLPPPPGAKNL